MVQLFSVYSRTFCRGQNALADFEKKGQYTAGTVFVEGLVLHEGKWYMYYGCADSFVGVAIYDPSAPSRMGDPLKLAVN